MAVKNSEITKSDVLPYDFVKENEVVASKIDNGYLVKSPKMISLNIYHEIQRYIDSNFIFELFLTSSD